MNSNQSVFEHGEYRCTSGKTIQDVRIGYETYGSLSPEKDNAILVCHYFSGNAHAAGPESGSNPLPGWWDTAIGPGKVLDTDRYFIVVGNSLEHESRADAMLGEIAQARAQALDANNFICMVRAFKLYDVRHQLHKARARYLFIPVETDQVFPPHLSVTAVETLRAAGLDAELFMLKCNGGHLDGLTQLEMARDVLTDFLACTN
jgi:homoserine acetyltransferase